MSWNRRLMLAEAVKGGGMELDYLTIIPEEDSCYMYITRYGVYVEEDEKMVYEPILCSTDGVTWEEVPDDIIVVYASAPLMLKSNTFNLYHRLDVGDNQYNTTNIEIQTSGPYSVGGTPLSLLHGDDFKTNYDLFPGCFLELFEDNGGHFLKRINNPDTFLPSTRLYEDCYNKMFYGCESLVNAPKLPATELADYCYESMFMGCKSLVSAPAILPAMELAEYCYYEMFHGCESLVKAPILPATDLVTYCYAYMFAYCHNLNYIEAMFLSRPSVSLTYGWVWDVAPQGTFVKNKNATWNVTGGNGIPEGWTVQTK